MFFQIEKLDESNYASLSVQMSVLVNFDMRRLVCGLRNQVKETKTGFNVIRKDCERANRGDIAFMEHNTVKYRLIDGDIDRRVLAKLFSQAMSSSKYLMHIYSYPQNNNKSANMDNVIGCIFLTHMFHT